MELLNSKTFDPDVSNYDNLNNASTDFYNYNAPNLDFPSYNVIYDHSNVDIFATEIYVEADDKMAVDANIYSAATRIGNLSATKAGISNDIQEKVAKVIYEASKVTRQDKLLKHKFFLY